MRNFLINRSLPLILLLVFGGSSLSAQTSNNTPLNNAAVVKLVKAGFKEKTILTIIASRPVNFELTPDRMIDLKRSGVTEKVILGMIARQEGNDLALSDETWSETDESFFNGSSANKNAAKPSNGNTGGSSLDIFGSSGGSKGSTKSRGPDGSSSDDVVTTGTATVRILRPPAEAGGAPAKLEKTKSLTNDSIIELIEAGFSEGTIIRRIEQSPVAFDFSADKLAELRKHRVSDKVLAAMRSAMGVDSSDDTKPSSSPASSNATRKQ
jgi:hypothetical protein